MYAFLRYKKEKIQKKLLLRVFFEKQARNSLLIGIVVHHALAYHNFSGYTPSSTNALICAMAAAVSSA